MSEQRDEIEKAFAAIDIAVEALDDMLGSEHAKTISYLSFIVDRAKDRLLVRLDPGESDEEDKP